MYSGTQLIRLFASILWVLWVETQLLIPIMSAILDEMEKIYNYSKELPA